VGNNIKSICLCVIHLFLSYYSDIAGGKHYCGFKFSNVLLVFFFAFSGSRRIYHMVIPMVIKLHGFIYSNYPHAQLTNKTKCIVLQHTIE
jgi:hypothetical protein